jgi:hypothetical protein
LNIHKVISAPSSDTDYIADDEYAEVVSSFAEQARCPAGPDQRSAERLECDVKAIVVWEVRQNGNAPVRYIIRSRNISRGGAAFLHNNYVHPGTPFSLTMLASDGAAVQCTGRVVRCQHVKGMAHDVGVEFDQPFDTSQFIGGSKE